MASSTPSLHEKGARHIASVCPHMGRVIKEVGPCRMRTERRKFAGLVRIIVGQQVSTKAAATIYGRLREQAGGFVTPDRLAELDTNTLRACGLSGQKTGYIEDLTRKVTDGEVRLDRFSRLDDAQVIEELTRIKGLGQWSAEMFLIFVLQRPDVLSVGDLGIQNGFQKVYNMRKRPAPRTMERLARPWAPYRSVGCWYLWRSLDAVPS